MQQDPILKVKDLSTYFGKNCIHNHLNLEMMKGEVLGIVGGSGTGKSVLLSVILGLIQPRSGHIELLGKSLFDLNERAYTQIRVRYGVLFQDGALFSGMSVLDNIKIPLKEYTGLPDFMITQVARAKINLVGLPQSAGDKFPSELSGGMRKRAGLARALALDPEILFLDEPTAGLDPIGATAFDQLIKNLQTALNLTVMMVTHDLDSLVTICDRIAALIDHKLVVGSLDELLHNKDPWLQEYFNGPRGRIVMNKSKAK